MSHYDDPTTPPGLDSWSLQVVMAASNVENREDVRQLPLRLQEAAVGKATVALMKAEKKKAAARIASAKYRKNRKEKREAQDADIAAKIANLERTNAELLAKIEAFERNRQRFTEMAGCYDVITIWHDAI